MIHSNVGLVFSFYIGGRRNAVQNFISNEWFGRRQRKTLRVGIPLVFVKFFSLFLTLFHPHLLRFYILPVPLTLAIWFALINRGEYCWHRVFPASKFLCLPYVTPKSYCSNFMDECKAEITLYGNVLIFMAHYRNISEWAVAMLTTDFSFGRRLRKPHIGQYIGITRGRTKSLAEFFFNIIADTELKSVRFRAKRFFLSPMIHRTCRRIWYKATIEKFISFLQEGKIKFFV